MNFVGVQAVVYSSYGQNNDYLIFGSSLSEDLLVGIVSAVMTVLVLVVFEIIPKTLVLTTGINLLGSHLYF